MPANRRSIPVLVALATVLVLGLALALLPRGSALEAEGATSGVVTATPDVAGLNVERVSVELSAPIELIAEWQSSVIAARAGVRLLVEDTEMIIIDTAGVPAQFSLRTFAAGVWGEWYEVEATDSEGPDANAGTEGAGRGASAIGPVWVGAETTAIEIVLQKGSVTELSIDKLEIDQSFAATDELSALTAGEQTASASAVARPAIKSRADWGAGPWNDQNSDCDGGPFLADNLRAVVVHHTVTTNTYSEAQVPGILRGIYYHHVNINGWCDIAYNFLIDRFGTIWQGRSGAVDQPIKGGHAKGFNSRTAGVALLGQYQGGISRPAAAYPTTEALSSLEALATWKLSLHGVDPLGKTWLKNRADADHMRFAAYEWVNLPTVVGHRDVGLTSCPGNRAYVSLAPMAERIADSRDSDSAPYSFPRWEGSDLGVAVFTVDSTGGMRPGIDSSVPPNPPVLGSATALAMDGTPTAGYILSTDGRLFAYGDAPAVSGRPGGSSPVDLQVRESGESGYVITADGVFHGFGGVIDRSASSGGVAGVIDNSARGYMVNSAGTLHPISGSPARSLPGPVKGTVLDLSLWSDGVSGWVLDSEGNAIGFGAAGTYATNMSTTPVGIIGSPTDTGGWVVDDQGQLWVFGDERPAAPVASHVGRRNSVGGAAVAWLRDDTAFRETNDGKWMVAMYTQVAGRQPSVTELEGWDWRIDFRGSQDLAAALVHTEHWAGQIVDDIYSKALGRAADTDGKAYWLAQLRDGMSAQELGIYFYGSSEYVARSGGNSGFVHRLYQNLLHRPADAEGHTYWVDLLNKHVARPDDVAAGFYQSLESRRDRVSSLYKRLVGSAPDPEDLEVWAEQLAGTDDLDFTAQLIAGPDFYRAAQ